MIDEDKTFRDKGYRSTDLSKYSKMRVWAVCEGENCQREGGRGRWVMFCSYRALCHSCAVRTGEHRKLLSDSSKGKTCGEKNGMYGRSHTDKSRLLISKNRVYASGIDHPNYGCTTSNKTRALMRENHADFSGENNPNWKGGVSSESDLFRHSSECKDWRVLVLERDDYTCQECRQRGGYLNVHHILPYSDWRDPEYSLNVDNGITLCSKCHDETKQKEYEFVDRYQKIVKKKVYHDEED